MIIRLVFLYLLVILGWLYGHSWHSNIEPDNSVKIPSFFIWIFGRPGVNGLYNIRGIYFQCLVFAFAGYFTLYNLKLLSQQDTIRLFILTMIAIVGSSELFRFLFRR